jgi:hypothetical protein
MGTAEKGYTSLGKGLKESTRASVMDTDFPSTTSEIEQNKRDVESGKGKGAEPLKGAKTAQVKKY